MLQERLDELFQHVCGGPGQPPPPSPSAILLAELRPEDFDGNSPRIRADSLRSPVDYGPRFEQLLTAGFAWLNMSYCGILRDHALVLIECPKSAAPGRGATSVNYSGPPKLVADAGWDARAYVVLV